MNPESQVTHLTISSHCSLTWLRGRRNFESMKPKEQNLSSFPLHTLSNFVFNKHQHISNSIGWKSFSLYYFHTKKKTSMQAFSEQWNRRHQNNTFSPPKVQQRSKNPPNWSPLKPFSHSDTLSHFHKQQMCFLQFAIFQIFSFKYALKFEFFLKYISF